MSLLYVWLLAVTIAASSLTPPVLPLAVRNPYLSTWLGDAREDPWTKWPIFWTGQEVGFSMMVHILASNTTYPLLGKPHDSFSSSDDNGLPISYPEYVGAQFDASTTNLTYRIPAPTSGRQAIDLVVSFLSPITPRSSLRQSVPASYISVTATGNTDIEIYVDVNGHWVSGNQAQIVEWKLENIQFEQKISLKSWSLKRQSEERFVEFNDRSEWGTLHLTSSANATHEAGDCKQLRAKFARTGSLSNQVDGNFRGIKDNEPVVALHQSLSLGSGNKTTTAHALFTISHTQSEVVQFASERGLTFMRPLWASFFFTEKALVTFHYLDYTNAKQLAAEYSQQLIQDAQKAGSSEYADIVALSARQVLGATSFAGTPANPLIFLKEISSNGNTQTVDVIFPAFPFFMYTNPRWLAYLLEPLLEHQLSGQYPNNYSMHDLGAHFPNLTGHADGSDEYMPVEECGDMLIMGLALVNSLKHSATSVAQSIWSAFGDDTPINTEDDSNPFALRIDEADGIVGLDDSWGGGIKGEQQAKKWVQKSYKIWKQWTTYLVDYSLRPANQLCTDDFAGWLPLQTNLALKGIIGIKAMSELSRELGIDKDFAYYKNISDTYIAKWRKYGMSRDSSHAKLAYDWYGSWTTLYSLFADAALCFHPNSVDLGNANIHPSSQDQRPLRKPFDITKSTNFIPSQLYANQSRWYEQAMQKYGLPLDSRHLYSKSDWQLEVAAVASPKVKRDIIHHVAKWLNETETNLPFTDLYDTENSGGFGAGNKFTARPVVGAHFSILALERACSGSGKIGFQFWEENEI